jgi:hypothetical protein
MMFTDEVGGEPIVEFVGLRAKMYSYVQGKHCDPDQMPTLDDKKTRAKGISGPVRRKQLRHINYREQLQQHNDQRYTNRRIGSDHNTLYTTETVKRGLCAYDDKRVLRDDGVRSWAWGHHAVPSRICSTGLPPELEPDPMTLQ